ncbi:MAG: glutamate--cysteine ligase [Herbaspirillum sp.]
MSDLLTRRLALLSSVAHRSLLSQGLHGIERETLRVDAQGHLVRTPHPTALGAALTHPQITTDYSESLLEFITPPEHDIATALDKLDATHRFAYSKLGDEFLWSQSMPCILPAEEEIPLAWYGSSHIGMLKHVYRRGLALRYGRRMQCIAGIHYNFSVAEELWQLLQREEQASGSTRDFQSESYIALVRNFSRHSWLLMYLFGASPALTTSFLRGDQHQLETLSADTLYLPYATSLRMSDLGYKNDAQAGLMPPYNTLREYMAGLSRAVRQPYPAYQALGTHRDGEWQQLNTNILQIENEYYATIRPKRVIHSGERPIEALCERGVQYIEARCMDVDPFEPMGINLQTARFLDAFLLFCALNDSPLLTEDRSRENVANFATVVKRGREPGLMLIRDGVPISMREWGLELLQQIAPVAQLLDAEQGGAVHQTTLAAQVAKIRGPESTPSALALDAIRAQGGSFARFGQSQSLKHAAQFRARPPSPVEQTYYTELARVSVAAQQQLEAADRYTSLDRYITDYQSRTSEQLCE